MRSLQEQLVLPVDDTAGRRATLVYASHEYLRLVPYAKSPLRFAFFCLLVLISCGTVGVFSVWFPQFFTYIARRKLPFSRVGDADVMLVLVHADGFRSKWVELPVHRPLKRTSGADKNGPQEVVTPSDERAKLPWVWFEFKKNRYVFNHETGEFERYLATCQEGLEKIHARLDCGLDSHQVALAKELFGENAVDIARPFIPMLLFHRVVHPYYLFQVFSAVVWFFQAYTTFAIVILVLSAISIAWEIYAEVSNSNRLRELVGTSRKVRVMRAGDSSDQKLVEKFETDLVPGDIVQLDVGPVVADVLLLTGGCVVDEASLTGEAVPVNKEAARGHRVTITHEYARANFKSSLLHAGSSITRVRDASGPCKAVVLSTGFSTGKGELFRSILFPRTIAFEFERDSYRYLVVLATIAIAAFIKRLVDFGDLGFGFGYTLVNSLDLFTITVPPALPLVLSSGIGFSLARLRKRGIFCIDSQRINSCGQLDTFCFDKTGTLTHESLALVGATTVDAATNRLTSVDLQAMPEQLQLAMATCHSLSDVDGELQGYSLELSMFAASQFQLEFVHEHKAKSQAYVAVASTVHSPSQFGVVKRFPFDAVRQRSSVIVEDVATKQRFIFVKGSPEAVGQISLSTPVDLKRKTLQYSADGNYCIGFGMRALAESESVDVDARETVEDKLVFLGMALFHNELKPEARGMLQELYAADVDVRMITGDNALTAVHVADLLEMKLPRCVVIVDVDDANNVVFQSVDDIRAGVDAPWQTLTADNVDSVLAAYSVALSGAALELLTVKCSTDSLQKIVLQTTVFARIRPAQKTWIVERLMDYGKIVGMCGDGTNDCGALKAAHVGLALSSAEASIVAPFTSQAKAVTDVPALIREGRCALSTSFLGFKFMVLYPIIQLSQVLVLSQYGEMLSNNQYLWDDLAVVLSLAITMLYTAPSPALTKQRPPHTLFSLTIVASILGQVLLYIAMLATALAVMTSQSWFCPRTPAIALVNDYMVDPSYVNETSYDSTILTNCLFYVDYIPYIEEEVDDIKYGHEDSTVWLFGHLCYFSVALAFNLKDRFRLPFYTNYYFTATFLTMLAVSLSFLLDAGNYVKEAFQTLPLTSSYRWTIFGLWVAHLALAQLWELFARYSLPKWRELNTETKEAAENTVGVTPKEEAPLIGHAA